MTSKVKKEIVVKGNKFTLEVYPHLESTNEDEFPFEIFPHDYNAALYAFSNKDSLNKLIKNTCVETKKIKGLFMEPQLLKKEQNLKMKV